MLRTTLDKAYLKRTLRPLYGWTQATPKSEYLSPDFEHTGAAVFPGMVATKLADGTVTLADETDVPMGLFGLYIGGDGINEVLDQGVNAVAVWVLGSEAEFEIIAPAFDVDGVAGGDPGDLLGADADGKLTIGGGDPVAKLIKIVSVDKIIVGGLRGTVA